MMQALELVNNEFRQYEIFTAIPLIMADLKPVGKDQKNVQQGFKFRGIDDVYNAVQKTMAKHGVFTTTKIKDVQRFEMKSAKGASGWHVVITYEFRFYAKDGSYIVCDAIGEAMDYGDKVSNKAASIAHKYALLQTFCIATEDLQDPDAESLQGEPVVAHVSHIKKAHQDTAPVVKAVQPAQPVLFDHKNSDHMQRLTRYLTKNNVPFEKHERISVALNGKPFTTIDQVIAEVG